MEDRMAVRVTIFGNEYTIRGDADAEYIRELARTVDAKMQEISKNANLTIPLKVSILTAINLADEVFRLRHSRPEPIQSADNQEAHPSTLAPEAILALVKHIEDSLEEPQQ